VRRPRYLILAAPTGQLAPAAADRLGAALRSIGAFERIWSGPRAAMFVEGPCLGFDHGAIAGTVFRRGSRAPVASLSRSDAALLQSSHGCYLADAHWGGYVALIDHQRGVSVLRAPLGDLACLVADATDGVAIASDVALLERAGCRTRIDYRALGRHLAAPDLRGPETCLAGVSEIQGGLRLELGDGERRIDEVWTPWKFAQQQRQISDSDDARRRLQDAILHAVAASAGPHGTVILRLSGGLDSSLVAAALSEARIPTVALNLVTGDAAGDERLYARRVAQSLGIELVERRRRLGAVDLRLSAAASLPRPSARAFVQASMTHAHAQAAEHCAGALVDGGGGDNVFCSLQSIRPVVDCLAAAGWRRALDTARSVAMLSQVSQWLVLRRAIVARAQKLSGYAFALDCRFLSRDAAAAALGSADHRWLHAPRGALPGKAAHIGLIAAAQSVVEGFDPLDPVPLLSPLISQPVVEACLAIPSWLWFDRGHNRAVARRTFADTLPRTILERRSKGGPDGFIAELYRHHRDAIREMLIDGLLMTNGLLDRAALADALDERGPVQRHDFVRVMQLVDAESWARSRGG
jgi:asparagine synthase (glutamine-hydrolysing)